ncbi:MAG: hypothetical protein QXX01_01835 [Candidatus Aenigmatarchaeota archaeon]|nr:hypothetical protein [Candidatus Aenigmarchaeota archaeon]
MNRYLITILLFIFLFSQASFSKIIYFGEESIIYDNLITDNIIMTIEPNETSQVKISFLFDIKNFSYSSNFPASCELSKSADRNLLICDTKLASESNRSLKINFISSNIKKENNIFSFKKEFIVYDTINSFLYKVYLPEGTAIISDRESIIPTYGNIASDGRKIFVYWQKNNLPLGELLSFQIFYESLIKEKTEIPLITIIIATVSILIIILIFRFRKKLGVQIFLPILKSDEKLIMELILKHGDGVNQKVIVRESKFSKAKVSKVLKNLSERGIIRLERIGRSNRIYVVKEFSKK